MNKQMEKTPSGTEEWAHKNVNISNGCPHNCPYCYAKAMAIRFKRNTPKGWVEEKLNDAAIIKDYRKVKSNGARHDIMFPTSHDITPNILEECVVVLRKLLESGNSVLIVSKPHLHCVKRLCEEFKDFKHLITFRFSIGSTDDNVLKVWEPFAPKFNHRVKCLKYAFENGFETSVSAEPILDTNTVDLINEVLPYVNDSIWIGKPNRLIAIVSLNTDKDPVMLAKAKELEKAISDEYIKKLYSLYANNPRIKWKDSNKVILGVTRATAKGLDI